MYLFLGIVSAVFFIFVFFCVRAYVLAKKILSLVKEIDYDTWLYLKSPSLPIVKYFMWVNPIRFGSFVKTCNGFNNIQLKSYLKRYVWNHKFAMACFIILMVLNICILFLALLLR